MLYKKGCGREKRLEEVWGDNDKDAPAEQPAAEEQPAEKPAE